MPTTPTYPGVYIEEIPSGVRTITGVATSITAFIGRARRGPLNLPVTINSYAEFERTFGVLWEESTLGYAVRDFFLNGGAQAIVVRPFHPYFSSDAIRDAAKVAAQAVADAATAAAGVANATPDSVKTAARTKANTFPNDPEKTASDVVAKAAEAAAAGPPGATPDSVKAAARAKASDRANAADPANTAADLIAKAAETSAAVANVTAAKVASDTRKASDDTTAASDNVAKAAETAAGLGGATAITTRDAARAEANKPANAADPKKTAADLTAKAAEAAAALGGATPDSVRISARAAADSIKQAAASVATSAEGEAAKVVGVVKDAATAAVAVAAALGKARLVVDTLNLEAAYEGGWGNQLRARVDYDVNKNAPDAATLFNLTVRDGVAGDIETFRNISLANNHPRNVDKILKNESKLARVRGNLPGAKPAAHANPQPAADVWADNNPATNSKVSELSSDGAPLDGNDFTGPGKEDKKEGLYGLRKADLFNLLCVPPHTHGGDLESSLIASAAAYCEKRRAMLIIDAPTGWVDKDAVKTTMNGAGVGTSSLNAAVFFPRLRQPNPLRENQKEDFVPCGAVAGVFARTDATRGVWKAPAGLDAMLVGVPELTLPLTDAENGELNPLGVNCLRSMPPAGRVVWGSRTLQGDDRLASEWKYIPVRRTALFLEETLYRNTQWVVFEPNDEPLWAQIRLNIGAFLHNLFRQGAFQGKTPAEAYFVKCDKETTTQADINLGIVNILVGFAPLKPAEFVIIKIQQIAGQIQA